MLLRRQMSNSVTYSNVLPESLLTESLSFLHCSGHRIGTAEVESALVAHDICAEVTLPSLHFDAHFRTRVFDLDLQGEPFCVSHLPFLSLS